METRPWARCQKFKGCSSIDDTVGFPIDSNEREKIEVDIAGYVEEIRIRIDMSGLEYIFKQSPGSSFVFVKELRKACPESLKELRNASVFNLLKEQMKMVRHQAEFMYSHKLLIEWVHFLASSLE